MGCGCLIKSEIFVPLGGGQVSVRRWVVTRTHEEGGPDRTNNVATHGDVAAGQHTQTPRQLATGIPGTRGRVPGIPSPEVDLALPVDLWIYGSMDLDLPVDLIYGSRPASISMDLWICHFPRSADITAGVQCAPRTARAQPHPWTATRAWRAPNRA